MWCCSKQFKKIQAVFFKQLSQHIFIAVAKIQDSQITEPIPYIFHNLVRLRFIQDKLKPFLPEMLYQFHKRICCESIMLR